MKKVLIQREEYEKFASDSRERRLEWFREARFGMFVHYGAFSSLGAGEWCMYTDNYKKAEYEEIAKHFAPKEDCTDEWCAMAKRAGAKYCVMTTRHHEGFSLWKSDANPYNSYNFCGRDLVAEFVASCRKYGLKIGFYSSLMDWHHPDGWRCAFDPEARRRFLDYIEELNTELLTRYGKIDILWYDMPFPMNSSEGWDAVNSNYRLRLLQPDILINNRRKMQEDFLTPEERISPADGAYWEACMTFNGLSWGYIDSEQALPYSYTPQKILSMLTTCTIGGGNLLLNIGPTPDGSVPEEVISPLEKIGDWLAENGEAVYGKKASGYSGTLNPATVSEDGKTLYLMNRIWHSDRLILWNYANASPKRITLLATGEEVDFTVDGGRIILTGLPKDPVDKHLGVTVFKMEFDEKPGAVIRYYPQMSYGANNAGENVQ